MSHIRNRQNGIKPFREGGGGERGIIKAGKKVKKKTKRRMQQRGKGTAINTFQFIQRVSSLMREVHFSSEAGAERRCLEKQNYSQVLKG